MKRKGNADKTHPLLSPHPPRPLYLATWAVRCAGDFCETRQGGQGQALGCNNPLAAGSHEVDIRKTHHVEEGRDEETNNRYRTMAGGQETGSVGDGGTDDILGRRKHALAVEIPRTVLFRLVRSSD